MKERPFPMFMGLTLEKQREFEKERGWKPSYSALTYCTAEGVVVRKAGSSPLDWEILVAQRTSGAPDCIGLTQAKWGTYVKPTDVDALAAVQRGIRESFGWNLSINNFRFSGIIGPHLYRATISVGDGDLHLHVTEDQAEKTPFEAKMFLIDATNHNHGEEGSYSKTTKDCRWLTLAALVNLFGSQPMFMYWVMVAVALRKCPSPTFPRLMPGEHTIQI